MMKNPHFKIVLLWVIWAIVMLGFQFLVQARFQPQRPDHVLGWTAYETDIHSKDNFIYLVNPFMNAQVAWDSEYYLSIATSGYNDTHVHSADGVSLNYAFFPLYPYIMKGVMQPFRLFGMEAIPAATLAGVLISLLGTLGGMLGLYELARRHLGEDGGLRAVFYLLIFPTGFFLAQVYTEGLFIGLTFGCLALLENKRWYLAIPLAVLATLTRSVGVVLIIPLFVWWLGELNIKQNGWRIFNWKTILKGFLILLPVAAYLTWHFSILGRNFELVERNYFGRQMLAISESLSGWGVALSTIFGHGYLDYSFGYNPQTAVYFSLELLSVLLALSASLVALRKYPGLALFSLCVLFVSVTSGFPQSNIRYMLPLPATFLVLSRLGKNAVFDKIWTLTSILLMGLLITLFTFNFWVA